MRMALGGGATAGLSHVAVCASTMRQTASMRCCGLAPCADAVAKPRSSAPTSAAAPPSCAVRRAAGRSSGAAQARTSNICRAGGSSTLSAPSQSLSSPGAGTGSHTGGGTRAAAAACDAGAAARARPTSGRHDAPDLAAGRRATMRRR